MELILFVPIISRGLDYRLGPTRMAIVFQKDIPYKTPGPENPIGPTINFYNSKAQETRDPGPKNKAKQKTEK